MSPSRHVHFIEALIPRQNDHKVSFLLYPHEEWRSKVEDVPL